MTLNEQQLRELGLTNYNAVTNKLYLGSVNQEKLNAQKRTSKAWVTFHQVKKNGWKLSHGSKGVVVTHVDMDEQTGEKGVISFHRVFNMDDVHTAPAVDGRPTPDSNDRPITIKQKHLLMKLIHARYADKPEVNRSLVAKLDSFTAGKASEMIGKFLSMDTVQEH